MKKPIKTIAIDCRSLTKPLTGVGTFARSVLDTLVATRPDWKLILLSPVPFHPSLGRDYSRYENVEVVISPFISEKNLQILWYNFKLPLLLKKYGADVFYTVLPQLPLFVPSGIRKVIVVHDVVNIEFAGTMDRTNYIVNKLFFFRSLKEADALWFNSAYTRSKVLEYDPSVENKPYIVGDSATPGFFHRLGLDAGQKKTVLAKYGITEGRTLLFVGSLEPRKNLTFLLSLMPALYEKGVRLLVVGASGWRNSDIASFVQSPSFPKESTVFCGYITDDDLLQLYNSVDCFVSTSLNEGFGMPQLEAMFCGCPVISPDNSAMSEVVGGRGKLIGGWDKTRWTEEILSYIEEEHTDPDLSKFSWPQIIDNFETII